MENNEMVYMTLVQSIVGEHRNKYPVNLHGSACVGGYMRLHLENKNIFSGWTFVGKKASKSKNVADLRHELLDFMVAYNEGTLKEKDWLTGEYK